MLIFDYLPNLQYNRDKWKERKKIPMNSKLFLLCFLTDSIGNIHHFKSDRRFYIQEVLQKYLIQLKLFTLSCLQEIILQRQAIRKNVPQSNIRTTIPKHKH